MKEIPIDVIVTTDKLGKMRQNDLDTLIHKRMNI